MGHHYLRRVFDDTGADAAEIVWQFHNVNVLVVFTFHSEIKQGQTVLKRSRCTEKTEIQQIRQRKQRISKYIKYTKEDFTKSLNFLCKCASQS